MRESLGLVLEQDRYGLCRLRLTDHSSAAEADQSVNAEHCRVLAFHLVEEEASEGEEIKRPLSLGIINLLRKLSPGDDAEDVVNSFEETLTSLLEAAFKMGQAYPLLEIMDAK